MLGKLLKYEVKATARLFIPLYFAVIIMALINRIINPFEVLEKSQTFNIQSLVSFMSIFLYIALIAAVLVMTLIMVIQRFYKNLLSDEGYLMFTLPVKSWQLVASKYIVAIMWMLVSLCAIIASILIVAKVDNLFFEISKAFSELVTHIGGFGVVLIILCPIVGLSYSINVIYDAMAIGHLFNKQRILASFGAYIVLYIIGQIVGAVSLLSFATINNNWFINNIEPSVSQINSFIIFMLAIFALLAAANYTITNIILKKKLNLE